MLGLHRVKDGRYDSLRTFDNRFLWQLPPLALRSEAGQVGRKTPIELLGGQAGRGAADRVGRGETVSGRGQVAAAAAFGRPGAAQGERLCSRGRMFHAARYCRRQRRFSAARSLHVRPSITAQSWHGILLDELSHSFEEDTDA